MGSDALPPLPVKIVPAEFIVRSAPLDDMFIPPDVATVKVVPSKVKFASPSKVLAVSDPVISLLSALLFIVVDVTAANVESPLRNVDELAVPDPSLAVGTVPEAKSDASKFVRFAPLIAGSVPVKFAAGKLVKLAPDPENVVAVVTPVANISPSGLTVIPEPTITSPSLLILILSVVLFV